MITAILGTAVTWASEHAGTLDALGNAITGGNQIAAWDTPKQIWSKIPADIIRVKGGSGKWTDTLTGQTMNDAGTDLRKSAVMASAIGCYNASDNRWFDNITRQYVDAAAAAQRWSSVFGSATFETAYRTWPQRFRIYGSNPANDPSFGVPNASAFVAAPAQAPGTSQPGAAPRGADGTGAGAAAPTEREAGDTMTTTAPQRAGFSAGTALLLLGVVVLISMASSKSAPAAA